MNSCPRCFHPVQDQDRITGVEAEDADDITGLYSCGFCTQWYVLAADGSTAAAEFGEQPG